MTLLWPCLGHKSTMFQVFLQCVSTSLKSFKLPPKSLLGELDQYNIIFNDWNDVSGMFGPHWGHVFAIFTVYMLLLPWKYSNFHQKVMEANRISPSNVDLLGPYLGYVWNIIRPFFCNFYHNFVSTCLKFSLKNYAWTTL